MHILLLLVAYKATILDYATHINSQYDAVVARIHDRDKITVADLKLQKNMTVLSVNAIHIVVHLKNEDLVLKRSILRYRIGHVLKNKNEGEIAIHMNNPYVIKTYLSFVQHDMHRVYQWTVTEKLEDTVNQMQTTNKHVSTYSMLH